MRGKYDEIVSIGGLTCATEGMSTVVALHVVGVGVEGRAEICLCRVARSTHVPAATTVTGTLVLQLLS